MTQVTSLAVNGGAQVATSAARERRPDRLCSDLIEREFTVRTVASEGLLPLKRYDAMISGSTSRSLMGGCGFGSDASVCFLGST